MGVDKVFLRENAPALPANLVPRVQGMIDAGFLDLGTLPGPKHPLQNRWYNRCSKPDMAGEHSWVAFLDLDEFMVVLDRCAPRRCARTPFRSPSCSCGCALARQNSRAITCRHQACLCSPSSTGD